MKAFGAEFSVVEFALGVNCRISWSLKDEISRQTFSSVVVIRILIFNIFDRLINNLSRNEAAYSEIK